MLPEWYQEGFRSLNGIGNAEHLKFRCFACIPKRNQTTKKHRESLYVLIPMLLSASKLELHNYVAHSINA